MNGFIVIGCLSLYCIIIFNSGKIKIWIWLFFLFFFNVILILIYFLGKFLLIDGKSFLFLVICMILFCNVFILVSLLILLIGIMVI